MFNHDFFHKFYEAEVLNKPFDEKSGKFTDSAGVI